MLARRIRSGVTQLVRYEGVRAQRMHGTERRTPSGHPAGGRRLTERPTAALVERQTTVFDQDDGGENPDGGAQKRLHGVRERADRQGEQRPEGPLARSEPKADDNHGNHVSIHHQGGSTAEI